jgi:hypothetical protein
MAVRNYKKEYKKFQSSPEAKAKRAELNAYNRKKGTYGNGDGLDAVIGCLVIDLLLFGINLCCLLKESLINCFFLPTCHS